MAKINALPIAIAHWYEVAPVGMSRRNRWGKDQAQPEWAKWSIVFMIRGQKMDTILTPKGWYVLNGGRPNPENLTVAPPIPGIQTLTLKDEGAGETYQCWGLPKTGSKP